MLLLCHQYVISMHVVCDCCGIMLLLCIFSGYVLCAHCLISV